MLVHFQYKPLQHKQRNQSWLFSFYFQGQFTSGTYYYDGTIEWDSPPKQLDNEEDLKHAIHDLMLYHVYEDEHQPQE
ncbi:DUF5342 family protein [Shouchella sp. 1P09AA]|uniref:DUF5342 family protein n=1 Tax=unclassified Shouchella TaxID=2893065 RepID=UPI0039A308AF